MAFTLCWGPWVVAGIISLAFAGFTPEGFFLRNLAATATNAANWRRAASLRPSSTSIHFPLWSVLRSVPVARLRRVVWWWKGAKGHWWHRTSWPGSFCTSFKQNQQRSYRLIDCYFDIVGGNCQSCEWVVVSLALNSCKVWPFSKTGCLPASK